jgi:hypothetical protein
MKTVSQLNQRIGTLQAQIEDLNRQQEENASKGNWTIVRAVKDHKQVLMLRRKELEWVVRDDEL